MFVIGVRMSVIKLPCLQPSIQVVGLVHKMKTGPGCLRRTLIGLLLGSFTVLKSLDKFKVCLSKNLTKIVRNLHWQRECAFLSQLCHLSSKIFLLCDLHLCCGHPPCGPVIMKVGLQCEISHENCKSEKCNSKIHSKQFLFPCGKEAKILKNPNRILL